MGGKSSKPVVSPADALRSIGKHAEKELQIDFMRLARPHAMSGSITKESFFRFLQPIFSPFKGNPQVLERIMQVLDTNTNGTVEWGEFVTASYVFRWANRDLRLRFIFNIFDVEGSGRISKKHFKTIALVMMTSASDQISTKEAQTLAKTLSSLVSVYVNSTYNICNIARDGVLTYPEWCKFADEDDKVLMMLECMERYSRVDLTDALGKKSVYSLS